MAKLSTTAKQEIWPCVRLQYDTSGKKAAMAYREYIDSFGRGGRGLEHIEKGGRKASEWPPTSVNKKPAPDGA